MSQGCEGVPAVQLRVPPPVLVIVMVWVAGLVPAVVVKLKAFVFNCMAGGGAVTVTPIETVAGLPVTAVPVAGFTAVMVTEVEAVVPGARPVALTLMVRVALVLAARVPLAALVIVT